MQMTRPTLALLSLLVTGASAWGTCQKFSEIYTNGEDMIERMWNNAFKYTADEQMAYTMWWYEGGTAGTADGHDNPNDLITQNLGKTVPDQCHLSYNHKEAPTPEGADFTECHPWHASACCQTATVVTPEQMKTAYGAGYHWDRCGKLSQACERFFVEEACFYECEVNTGLYRKYTDAQHAACSADGVAVGATVTLDDGSAYNCTVGWKGNDENQWQMFEMPIKASYADAWYRACANDMFCGGGDYFACAYDYTTDPDAFANLTADELADCPANLKAKVQDAWMAGNVSEPEAAGVLCAELEAEERAANAEAEAAAEAAKANAEAAKANASQAEAAKLAADLEEEENKGLEPWAMALIIVFAVLGVVCAAGLCLVVSKEKAGKPMFVDLDSTSGPGAKSAVELNKA